MQINSLLDTDLYKLTMMQIAYHKFPTANVEYKFINRGAEDLRPYKSAIQQAVNKYATLRLKQHEYKYLESLGIFKKDFLDYLNYFKLNAKDVRIEESAAGLHIRVKGNWVEAILWEIYILDSVNELYFEDKGESEGIEILKNKLELLTTQPDLEDFKFADFGTRRRYSKKWQLYVLRRLKERFPRNFVGTSNVGFTKKLGIKPIGTMAHEYIQAFQGIVHPINSQKEALRTWNEEYRGNLGIALTDTITMDAFLKDFDLLHAKLYDGLRHDSGDPIEWATKAISHYMDLGIDPKTKTLVFSDGLNFPDAIAIYRHLKQYIKVSFGIGTNLTNDCGYKPLSIVMKMVKFNGLDVAKISDNSVKNTCENNIYLTWLKSIFKVPL